jgi:hypothetical protein
MVSAMDKLDREIQAMEREVANAERALAKAKLELATLRRAASLRPSAGVVVGHANGIAAPKPANQATHSEFKLDGNVVEKRRGKAKGAISAEWQKLLGLMSAAGNEPKGYADIHELAPRAGIHSDLHSIRERIRAYVREGHIEANAPGIFRVSRQAIERYGLGGAKN